jgi:ACS family glucarate transporter-like MFS transporter
MNDHDLEDVPLSTTSLNDDFGQLRPTRVRYQVLAAACSLAVITYIHRVGFGTAAAELKTPLGLSAAQISWLMAAFMVGYGLFEMPWGFLGDRIGVRNILAAIILGGSLLTAGLALVGLLPRGPVLVFAALLVLRFLFGAVQAGTFPVISRMMADWMPTTERGSAQGAVWMSSRVGGFIAPLLIVWLFEAMGDWKLPLVLVAGLGLLWCLVFWPWFRNHPEEMPQVNTLERKLIEAGRGVQAAHGHGPVPWAKMARSPSVWALCGMYGFLGFSGNFYLTLLPTYLKNHRLLDSTTMSWLSGLPFGFGVLACFAGGWFSDAVIRRWGKRWGRRIVGGTGLMLAGFAIVLVPWVNHVVLLGFLLILTFVGNDLAMAPAWASAADIGERYTGVLSGAMNMMASFMAAIQALVIGHLFEMNNLVAPFIILAASYALGTLCWIGVDVRKTLAESG